MDILLGAADRTYFGPEEISILTDAFELSWHVVRSAGVPHVYAGRDDRARNALARSIIEQAQKGERDVARLCSAAIDNLPGRPN